MKMKDCVIHKNIIKIYPYVLNFENNDIKEAINLHVFVYLTLNM
jgi:hypothetical protein